MSEPQTSEEPRFELEKFYLVLLLRGDGGPFDDATLEKLQEGHQANIRRLAEADHMVLAGPFGPSTPEEMRGIFLLRAESQEQAEELINSDPMMQVGRLKAQVLELYLPKGRL